MGREVRCPDEWERLIRAFPTRRDVVKLAGLAGVAALPAWVSSCLKPAPTAPPTRESSPPRTAPIEGYANATSYRVGETASFQVSNNSGDPRIEVEVVRAGAADTSVLGPWHDLAPSQSVPRQPAQYGCGWSTTFQFVIPSSWSSGVYVVRLSPIDDPRIAPTEIPFVVKPANPTNSTLYQLPVSTYQAYNAWAGGSLYTVDSRGYSQPFASFDRPYADLHQFKALDLPFIRWMEREGFKPDYCTSIDLHSDPQLRLSTSGYQLMLSVGHDEYWSWEMRDNVEDFIEAGGNVAFFGGNTCWWQIRFEPDTRRIVCYKDPQRNTRRDPAWAWGPEGQRRVTTNWFASPVNRPEERMTGLSFRYGAAWWRSQAPPAVPLHVGPSEHWVFAGLPPQSVSSALQTDGWETDAAHLRVNQNGAVELDRYNIPVVSEDPDDGKPVYQPPSSTLILASTDLLPWPRQRGRATPAIYRNNGVVFNAATTDWPIGLTVSDQVRTVTRNVIQGLSSALPPSPSLLNLSFDAWSSSSQPDGWSGGTGPQGTQQVFQETHVDFKRTGTSSLRINAGAGYAWLSQGFPAIGGRYYAVSGWIRSSSPLVGNDGHWLVISIQDVDRSLNLGTARYTARDGGWQHVRAYARAAVTGTIGAEIKVESYLPVDAWFDDLQVDLL